jgi:c-di-GMP-binding flagellar brake protein YcgR
MAIDPKDLSIHDEIVVETEIDGAVVRLSAFVTNVLADELWLATRLPEPRLLNLEEGLPIHLTFDRDGAVIVESVFLRRLGAGGRLGMEKSRVFAVRRPGGVETVQRRAHVRVDLERAVRIRALGSLGVEKIGAGRTVNIGAGGVQFLTDMPLLFGEQLRLALALTSREIVVAGGTIVRIEDGEAPAADAAGLGRATPAARAACSKVAVRFDKISEVDQERITCHILAAHRRRAQAPAIPAAESPMKPDQPASVEETAATPQEAASAAAPDDPSKKSVPALPEEGPPAAPETAQPPI